MVLRPCLDCPGYAAPGIARCRACHARRERPYRAAYGNAAYRAQPRRGTCWLCGEAGADTRDHVVPVAVQVSRYGRVVDHRTRPAHRACNSGRGAKSSEGSVSTIPTAPFRERYSRDAGD